MPNGRYTFQPGPRTELGRHESYSQALDGEYVFARDPRTKPPFDTYNDVTKDLLAIVGECVRLGKRLRARGSLWSLSAAAVTNGRLINTTQLRVGLDVPPTLAAANYAGDVAKLRFVECGNSISALNEYLFKAGLSLQASGSNDGQTIVGALSTGTHGGAYKFGAISEMVVGIHLICGPNKHVYLERQSYPVMQPRFAQMLGGAEFKADDTLFNAALQSFGSFGIIHGLMIETRSLFALNALRFKVPYDATLRAAITTCDPTLIPLPAFASGVNTDKPYHFEFFVNVNEPAAPQNAYLQVMYETPYNAQTYQKPKWDGGKAGLGADGLNTMGALIELIPDILAGVITPFLNNTIEEEFAPYRKTAIIRDLFRGEKTVGKTLAAGVGMPASRAVEAMDIAFKRYRDNGEVLPALLSCRFVKPTKALLGFQRFEPTAVFEMDSVNIGKTRRYFEQVWGDLEAAGIPFTLHWGKYNNFWTPARLRARFGNALDQWVASRTALLESPQVRECFNNPFMAAIGLPA